MHRSDAPLSAERAADLDARKEHYERQHPQSLAGGRFRFNHRQSVLHHKLHKLLDEDTGRLTQPVLLNASTGDGKTDVALSMYMHGVRLAREKGRDRPKMLAIVDAQRGDEVQRQLLGMGIRAHVIDGIISGPEHPRKGSCNKLLYSNYVDAQAHVDVMIVGPSMYQTLHTWKSGYSTLHDGEARWFSSPYAGSKERGWCRVPSTVANTRQLLEHVLNRITVHPDHRDSFSRLRLLTHRTELSSPGDGSCTVTQALGELTDPETVVPPLSAANASILYEFLFGDPSVAEELQADRPEVLRLDPDRDSATSEVCATLLARMHGAHCSAALSPLLLYGFDYDFLMLDEFPNRKLMNRLLDRSAREVFLRRLKPCDGHDGPPMLPEEQPVYPLILSATPNARMPCLSAFRVLRAPSTETPETTEGDGELQRDLPIISCRSVWGTEQPSAMERMSAAIAAAKSDVMTDRSTMHDTLCMFDPSQEEFWVDSRTNRIMPSDLALLLRPTQDAHASGAAALMSALLGPYRRDPRKLSFEDRLRRGVFRYFVHAQKRRHTILHRPMPPEYDVHLNDSNYPTSRMVYYFLSPLVEHEDTVRRYEQQPDMQPHFLDLRSSNPKQIIQERYLEEPLYRAASECFREALGVALVAYPHGTMHQIDLVAAVLGVLDYAQLPQLAEEIRTLLRDTPPSCPRRREALETKLCRLCSEVAPPPQSIPCVDLRRLYVAHAACRVAIEDRDAKSAAAQECTQLWGLAGTPSGQLTERQQGDAIRTFGRLLPRLPRSDRLRLRRLFADRHATILEEDATDSSAPSLPPLPSFLSCSVPSPIQGIGSAFAAMPQREEDYRAACTDDARRLAWSTPGARRVLSVGRVSHEPVAGLGYGKDSRTFYALTEEFHTNMDAALWVRWRSIECFQQTCFEADRYLAENPRRPGDDDAPGSALRPHGRDLLRGTFDYASAASEVSAWIQRHGAAKDVLRLEGIDDLLQCIAPCTSGARLYSDRVALRDALREVGVQCRDTEHRLHRLAQLARFRSAERRMSEDGPSRAKRRRVELAPPGWAAVKDGLCEGTLPVEDARQWLAQQGAPDDPSSPWREYLGCLCLLLSCSPMSQVFHIPALVQNIMRHLWSGSPRKAAPVVSHSSGSKPLKTLAEDVANAHRRAEDCDVYLIHILPQALTRGTNVIAHLGGSLALVGEGYAERGSNADTTIQFKGRLQRQCPALPSVPLARSIITMCGNGMLWDEVLCPSGPWGLLFEELCNTRSFLRATARNSLQRAVLSASSAEDNVMFATGDAYTVVSGRVIASTQKADAMRELLGVTEPNFRYIKLVDSRIRALPKQSASSQHRDALAHRASACASQQTIPAGQSQSILFDATYRDVRSVFEEAVKRQRSKKQTAGVFENIGSRPRVVLLRRACAMEVVRSFRALRIE